MARPTETPIDCPECDWPMLHEDVHDTPNASDSADLRGGRAGHHEHARCPNCGYVVEPAMPNGRP